MSNYFYLALCSNIKDGKKSSQYWKAWLFEIKNADSYDELRAIAKHMVDTTEGRLTGPATCLKFTDCEQKRNGDINIISFACDSVSQFNQIVNECKVSFAALVAWDNGPVSSCFENCESSSLLQNFSIIGQKLNNEYEKNLISEQLNYNKLKGNKKRI